MKSGAFKDVPMKIQAVIYEKNGVYGAKVPALPGCFASGRNKRELRANLREAIALYIEAQNEQITRARKRNDHIEVVEVRV